jgi:ferredoxin
MVMTMPMETDARVADHATVMPHVALGAVRVEVDSQNCIGCGSCAAFALQTFIINDDLIAELTGELDDVDSLLSAADACPVYAITVIDADGSRLYPKD